MFNLGRGFLPLTFKGKTELQIYEKYLNVQVIFC